MLLMEVNFSLIGAPKIQPNNWIQQITTVFNQQAQLY